MRGLAGKGVLVCGGSSGIGLAAAARFLEEGSRVFIAGLEPEEVDAAVAGLRQHGEVSGMACDVSQEIEVARLAAAAEDALGGVDVLANNAGTSRRAPFLDITTAEWDRIIAVNLRGMFLAAQAVTALMARRGTGVVINMSSTNGMAGEEHYAHYNASKGGVRLLSKSVALSEACWPEALTGDMPVIYPFIVNDPGEAAQAKRRLGAVTIGHLPPPLADSALPPRAAPSAHSILAADGTAS